MTKTQLQTLSDLVSIAHEKYDGNPFYKLALERFDALLVIMNINAAKENAPGNAAVLRVREALESIEDDCRVLDRKDMWEEEGECYYDALRDIRETVSAALSAPPRNCDCAKDEAESAFAARFGRPWNTAEDELASWLFDLAEGGAS